MFYLNYFSLWEAKRHFGNFRTGAKCFIMLKMPEKARINYYWISHTKGFTTENKKISSKTYRSAKLRAHKGIILRCPFNQLKSAFLTKKYEYQHLKDIWWTWESWIDFNLINDHSVDPAFKYAGQSLPWFCVLASEEWGIHFYKKFLMNKSWSKAGKSK